MSCYNLVYDFAVKVSTGAGTHEDTEVLKNVLLSQSESGYYVNRVAIDASGTFNLDFQNQTAITTLMIIPETQTNDFEVYLNGSSDAHTCRLYMADVEASSVSIKNIEPSTVYYWVLFARRSS